MPKTGGKFPIASGVLLPQRERASEAPFKQMKKGFGPIPQPIQIKSQRSSFVASVPFAPKF
jgi:hypothetical protein